ncbi:MAG: rhomboid family protein [Candidatus Hydrogenedentota bacterium]
MTALSQLRCFHHGEREAAARCPECRRYFCRECIAEHDGRVVCSSCLARISGSGATKRRGGHYVVSVAGLALAVVLLWSVFYGAGSILLALPDEFHSGELWKQDFWGE